MYILSEIYELFFLSLIVERVEITEVYCMTSPRLFSKPATELQSSNQLKLEHEIPFKNKAVEDLK